MSEQKTIPEGYATIATKVPVWISDLLKILAKQRGMELYELLQLLVNGFVTVAKHSGPITPEIQLLIDSLRLDAAYNKAFNFASPTATAKIVQMVLVIQQNDHNGLGMVMIDSPFMEEAMQTVCVDSILERIVELSISRDDYLLLREIGKPHHSNSVRQTLTHMVKTQLYENLKEEDLEELRKLGYGEYHDYGRPIEYGKKYVRKRRRTPDSLANSQQRIHFDDFDRDAANIEADFTESEHKGNSDPLLIDGIKPFDVEP